MKKVLLLALLGFVSLSVYSTGGGGGAAAGDGEGAMDARDVAYMFFGSNEEVRPQYTNPQDIPTYSARLSRLSSFDLRERFGLMHLGLAYLSDKAGEAVQLIKQIMEDTGLYDVGSIFYDKSNNLKTDDVALLQDCYDYMIDRIRLADEQDEFGESSDEFVSQQSVGVRFYMNTIKPMDQILPDLAQKIKADLEKLRTGQSTVLYKAKKSVGAAASTVGNAASAAVSSASNAASAAWSYFSGWGRTSPAAGDTASVVGSPAAGGDYAASTVDSPAAGSDGVVEVEVDDDTDDE